MSASKGWIPRLKLIGGALCLDIANTTGLRLEPDGEEALRDYEDLVAWAEHAGALDEKERRSLLRAAEAEPKKVAAVHRRAIVLREAIYSIFSAVAARRAPEPGDVDLLNEAVAEAYRHLCLVPTASGFTWEWRGVEGALELPLWKVARSAADLLVSPELERVRECASARVRGREMRLALSRREPQSEPALVRHGRVRESREGTPQLRAPARRLCGRSCNQAHG
jgi:predicted RNA-binding Zn ribbon-like protein